MPSLLIPDVEDVVLADLRASASDHKRSVEQEAREVLLAAMAARRSSANSAAAAAAPNKPEHIVDRAQRLFGREWGFHLDVPPCEAESDRPVALI